MRTPCHPDCLGSRSPRAHQGTRKGAHVKDSHREEESYTQRLAKARRIVKGERVVLIMPLKRPHRCIGLHGEELTPALWFVTFDGTCVDIMAKDEADAERIAKKALEDPDLPCWLQRRPTDVDTP